MTSLPESLQVLASYGEKAILLAAIYAMTLIDSLEINHIYSGFATAAFVFYTVHKGLNSREDWLLKKQNRLKEKPTKE